MTSENEAKDHWERVFRTKDTSQVSWYQSVPKLSLDQAAKYSDPHQAIIDVGGGDSRMPDELLKLNYEQISIVDISETALEISKKRLGKDADKVNWLNSNILDLNTNEKYHLWHDRAVFHFLTESQDKLKYKKRLVQHLADDGVAVIGTFSKNDGPLKCSGLDVARHNDYSMKEIFAPEFEVIDSFSHHHLTPSSTTQEFHWTVLKLNKND